MWGVRGRFVLSSSPGCFLLIDFHQRRENACCVTWIRSRMSPIKRFKALWSNAASIQSNLSAECRCVLAEWWRQVVLRDWICFSKVVSKGFEKRRKVSLHKNKLYTKARSRITASSCSPSGMKRKFMVLSIASTHLYTDSFSLSG